MTEFEARKQAFLVLCEVVVSRANTALGCTLCCIILSTMPSCVISHIALEPILGLGARVEMGYTTDAGSKPFNYAHENASELTVAVPVPTVIHPEALPPLS